MARVGVILLLLLNCFLAFSLAAHKKDTPLPKATRVEPVQPEVGASSDAPKLPAPPAYHSVRSTPFAGVYSNRPHEFAANLRKAGCPEETVKDILAAEIGRRYHPLEQDLRPTPGDHLPRGWSTRTHEAKIIERRQRAAAMVREKEAALRQALGYEVKVPMPAYAMTVSDQRFNQMLDRMTPEQRNAAYLANEQYWTMVEQLRARTKGFWESADLEELDNLKAERQKALAALEEAR
jgi:hypothetical protein